MPHLRPPICSSRRALLPSPLTSRLLRPSRLQEGAGEGGQGGDGGPGVHGEHSGARRQMAGTSCGKGCAGAALGCAGTSGSGGRRASSPPSPALPHAAPETAHLLFPSCAAAFSSDQSIALPFSPAGGGRGGGAGRGRWSWRARRARWGAAADGRHVTWERLCWGGAGLHRHWRQAAGRQAGRPAGRQDCLAAALQGRACSAGPSPSPIHPLFPQSARPPACAPMAERKARPSSFSTSSRKRARISSSLMLLGSTRSSATAAPPFSPPFSPAGGGRGGGGAGRGRWSWRARWGAVGRGGSSCQMHQQRRGGARAWVGLGSLATSSGMPQVGGRASPARQQYIRHTRSALPPPCPSFSQARRNTEGHEPSLIMSYVLGSAPGSHTLYMSSSWQRGRGGGGRALSACIVLDGAQKQENAVGAIKCLFKPLYTATSCQGSLLLGQGGGGGGACCRPGCTSQGAAGCAGQPQLPRGRHGKPALWKCHRGRSTAGPPPLPVA